MSYTYGPLTPAERTVYGGAHPLHIVEIAGKIARKDKRMRVTSELDGREYGYDDARIARAAIERASELLPARTSRATALRVLSQTHVALKVRMKATESDLPAELLDDAIESADPDAIAALAKAARESKAARGAKAAAAKAARQAKADAAESSPRNTSGAPRVSPVGDEVTTVTVEPTPTAPTAAEIRAAILSGTFTREEWKLIADALSEVSPV